MKYLLIYLSLLQIPANPIPNVPEFRPGQVLPDAPNDAAYNAAVYLKSALEAEYRVSRPVGYLPHSANLRFISLYNLSTQGSRRKLNSKTGEIEQFSPLDDMTRVLLFVVNQTNRINPPATLIRIKPDLYAIHYDSPGWTAEAWDSLASKDSYFHREWIEDSTWNYLTTWTYTEHPIMRADQFISLSTVAPDYYSLLGLPDTAQALYKLLGIDEKLLADAYRIKGSVKTDGLTVTLNNRILERRQGAFDVWTSNDVVNSKGKKNALRQLDVIGGDIHKLDIDGNEYFFELGWGGWGTYLSNAAGKRVDEVPIAIATDDNFRDHRVLVGRSCFTCHDQGIKSFTSDQTKLFNNQIVQLRTIHPQDALALAGRYDENSVQRFIRSDQENYRLAVESLLETTPEKIAFMYSTLWRQYNEERVGLHQAALECGLSDDGFISVLVPSIDPNLLYLISQPGGKQTLSRDVWEDVFNQVMLLKGKPVAPKDRVPMPAPDLSKIKRNSLEQSGEIASIKQIDLEPAKVVGETRDVQFTIKSREPVAIKSYVQSSKVFLSADQEARTEHTVSVKLTAEQDGFAQSVDLELSNGKKIKIPIVIK